MNEAHSDIDLVKLAEQIMDKRGEVSAAEEQAASLPRLTEELTALESQMAAQVGPERIVINADVPEGVALAQRIMNDLDEDGVVETEPADAQTRFDPFGQAFQEERADEDAKKLEPAE